VTVQGVTLLQGDSREMLDTLPAGCVHTIVTSPPYFQQRDYQAAGQFGLEESLDDYIANLVAVFRAARRVLRDDGTLWLNLGDKMVDKQLLGVPWKVALALQKDGWFLRQDIILHKVTAMPEAVVDRCCRAHEYLFLLSKSKRYFYDPVAIMEEAKTDRAPSRRAKAKGVGTAELRPRVSPYDGTEERRHRRTVWTYHSAGTKLAHFAAYHPRTIEPCILAGTSEGGACSSCGTPRKRLVRKMRYATRPGRQSKVLQRGRQVTGLRDPERHVTRVETTGWQAQCDCGVHAGPSVVLDPFSGTGSTGVAAVQAGCRYIGIDLNGEFTRMAAERLAQGSLLLLSERD